MKKALNLTSLIVGIVSLIVGLFGLIALIMTIAAGAGFGAIIAALIVVLAQMAMGVLLIMGPKKNNAILTLVAAVIAFILIILDLFVLGGMCMGTGAFFAGLIGSFAFLTIFQVIGYFMMAAIAAIIVLQIVEMVKKN